MPTQLSVLFKSRGEVGAYLTARKIKKDWEVVLIIDGIRMAKENSVTLVPIKCI